jgi:hypothetical protein
MTEWKAGKRLENHQIFGKDEMHRKEQRDRLIGGRSAKKIRVNVIEKEHGRKRKYEEI